MPLSTIDSASIGAGTNVTGNAATATNVDYSGLTGVAPTWNQNTTGNAATATSATTAGSATTAATVTGAAQAAITSAANLATVGTVTTGTWSGAFGAVSGANLTTLNASNLASGTVATARLGTGTANTTTYLRGDNTWSTVSGGVTSITAGNGLTGGTISTSGTIALDYYTGTAQSYASYPVGSYVALQFTVSGVSMLIVNQSSTIYSAAGTYGQCFGTVNQGSGSAVLAGTWRSRGQSGYSSTDGSYWYLMQRMA